MEAIWISKTDNMNRDEGSYQLSHVWDKLLHTDDRHRKSVLMKASDVKPKRCEVTPMKYLRTICTSQLNCINVTCYSFASVLALESQ